jgi:hypothetical protein
MIDVPTTFLVALGVYAVLMAAGAVLLAAAATTTLRGERRVRLARQESIPAHYLRLARSH